MRNWLDRFIKWLKQSLGLKVDRPSVRILEEYHSDGISVLRIADDNIPGCIDLWRIDRHHERIKFFICLINTAHLQQELAALGVRRSDIAKHHGGSLVDRVQQQLQEQSEIAATHYWITGWDKEFSAIDRNGKAYHSHRTADVRLLACDLQGAAGSFAGDRYARYFARQIIKRLAANEFRERSYHRTWQAAVKAIDWSELLTGLVRGPHGIDLNHVLQPPRAKLKKSR